MLTLIVMAPPGCSAVLPATDTADGRIEAVVEVGSVEDVLATAREATASCAVVRASSTADLSAVDSLVAVDSDLTVLVVVPAGEVALGLDAVRRGAQDFLEVGSDQQVDAAALMRTLNVTIERSRRVVHRLREHRRMTKMLEHAGEGYLVVDPSGSVLTAGSSLDHIWPEGFDHLDTIFDALHPDDRDLTRKLGAAAIAHPGRPAIGEVRAIDSRGEAQWFEIRVNDQTHDQAIGGLIINVRDITDRVTAELERRSVEERFRLGFEKAAVGMSMAELDGTLTQVNEALCSMLGRSPSELIGHSMEEFLHPEATSLQPLIARLLTGELGACHAERRFLHPDGTTAWVVATSVLVPAGDTREAYLYSQFQDVTDRKQSERALAHQSMHDALTGLPNRTLLQQRLATAVEFDPRPPAVLYIDLDNFKVVNDGLGHTVGDQVLVEVADRLRGNIRSADTVARFGGDEFAVVLRNLPDVAAAVSRAEHLLGVLNQPVTIDGETHFVSVSIGVAFGGPGATTETLVRDADAALHQAKAMGRERVELFRDQFHSRAEHRLRTGTRMRHALEAGHFHVAYQPFLTIAEERVVGMEALLRWVDPDDGPISPGEFIPVAEQTGLIVQLGAWALDQALAQLRVWCDQQPWGPDLSLSVNLSPRQLTVDGLIDSVQRSIIDTGVDAGALCLEITETAVMADIETSIGLMRMMRSLGVDLSIDDFGTGYSSLNYLKSLPLTTLKVDQSFIAGLGRDTHDTSIVEAVVALGHALGMRVHAEGVERPEQLAELRRIGCDDAQGWLWAPAMPGAEFEVWMNERRSR